MCKLCKSKVRSPTKVGDLVLVKVSKDRFLNALITKRINKSIVLVRYSVQDMDIELKMIEKCLYTLNKKCCSIV